MNTLKQKASYNNPNAPSVTNTVEDILKNLKIERILYQGSDKVFVLL
ncbi:MAG: Unknown protein [uncultured Sulfurovum sp.]|uniref:Uncharacterized protein n=1 Tax=uncultured Sulfurovum sp. TaxID=269237 RepID=A0A6S6S382_9BACT|nr:MAG: Unknown protein [uncultured Sulfurovum sp.]